MEEEVTLQIRRVPVVTDALQCLHEGELLAAFRISVLLGYLPAAKYRPCVGCLSFLCTGKEEYIALRCVRVASEWFNFSLIILTVCSRIYALDLRKKPLYRLHAFQLENLSWMFLPVYFFEMSVRFTVR